MNTPHIPSEGQEEVLLSAETPEVAYSMQAPESKQIAAELLAMLEEELPSILM